MSLNIPTNKTTPPKPITPPPNSSTGSRAYSDSFDINEIGAGFQFKSGTEKSKNLGLWKSLGSIAGKSVGSNLSDKNLEIFHGLISDHLKDRPAGAPELSRGDKQTIMYKAYDRHFKKGELSKADLKDLRRIVDALSHGAIQSGDLAPELPQEQSTQASNTNKVELRSAKTPRARSLSHGNILPQSRPGAIGSMAAAIKSQFDHEEEEETQQTTNKKNAATSQQAHKKPTAVTHKGTPPKTETAQTPEEDEKKEEEENKEEKEAEHKKTKKRGTTASIHLETPMTQRAPQSTQESNKKTFPISWKIGGEAGFGIKNSGEIFSRTCTRSGYFVFGYSEYPSLIRGGHNTYQANVAKHTIESNKETVDILIALNRETIEMHESELSQGAVVIYDATKVAEKDLAATGDVGYTRIGIPLTQLAKTKGGADLMRNTVALGASIALLQAEWGMFIQVLEDIYGKKGAEIFKGNVAAAEAGRDALLEQLPESPFVSISKQAGNPDRMLMTGNDAVSLGAIAGGLQMYVAYPMTPASSVLHTLAAAGDKYGIVVKHAEDEISVINMAIGASFAGVRSMIGTSGGGFALMGEGFGLSCITETPLVVFEAMRPGPATGLPTWSDQGDLRFLMHAAQGEGERVIIAPGDLQECYDATKHALYLSEKYQLPVIVLSDKVLGESHLTSDLFIDEEPITNKRYSLYEPSDAPDTVQAEYHRYAITDSGISPRALPGQPGGLHLANSDEHDPYGYSDESVENRNAQVEKRKRKLDRLTEELPQPIMYGAETAEITFVGWGSVKGPVRDAMRILHGMGISTNFLHLQYLVPFPAEYIALKLSKLGTTLLVENNSDAQLAGLIKQYTGHSLPNKLLKYDGRPFWPEEIVRETQKVLES